MIEDVYKRQVQCCKIIDQENRLIYYFTALNGLATKIIIQKDWAEYIVKNQQIIWGWLEYNMILYIQKRNPNVPGIADKLYPPKAVSYTHLLQPSMNYSFIC